jgi:hypothetical protein
VLFGIKHVNLAAEMHKIFVPPDRSDAVTKKLSFQVVSCWCILRHGRNFFFLNFVAINSAYYKEILEHLTEAVQSERPKKWQNSQMLHCDDVPCHVIPHLPL